MSELFLLDTHVLLWAVREPKRLSAETLEVIQGNRYAVSVASLWELITKRGKKDAPVVDPIAWWEEYVMVARTIVLPIRVPHVMRLDRLPLHHRDPYDRILVAQSIVERMPIVTSDRMIRRYDVEVREAS